MELLKKAYQFFFILGIFLIPFNSDIPEWFSFLGEYSVDSSPFFFLIGIFILLIYQVFNGKIYFPVLSKTYFFFLVFLFFIILTTLFNLPHIYEYYFKATSGFYRFIRQFISVIISGVLFFYLFVNVCRDYGLERFVLLIRKIFLISFVFVFSYGVLEYSILKLNLLFLRPLLDLFSYLPFVEVKFSYSLIRLSSLTYEPPSLGAYLIIISGFIFSYILTSKKPIRFLPFVLLVILAIISGSRTAFVVIIAQTIAGIIFSYYKYFSFRKAFKKIAVLATLAGIAGVIFFWEPIYESSIEKIESLNFSRINIKTDESALSNKSRIGIQAAMLEVFKERPIIGTGWGQQTFESRFHYPVWATTNNYEFRLIYRNQLIRSFPPAYNLYLRILVETGIIGFISFMVFLYFVIKACYLTYINSSKTTYISIILLISFIGTFLNWFQTDSFRVYGFWLSLAILIIYTKSIVKKEEEI